jgi:hypothetical protein
MGQRSQDTPKYLTAKLLVIRHKLEATRSQMAKLVDSDKGATRIEQYEAGICQPALLVLFRYATLARVPMAVLVNDKVELEFPTDWIPLSRVEVTEVIRSGEQTKERG